MHERGATDPQPVSHLAQRVAPILDLRDRIALKLICEFSFGHLVLLASKMTKQGGYKSRGYSYNRGNHETLLLRNTPRQLHQRPQLLAKIEDPKGPYALRVHLQTMDKRT